MYTTQMDAARKGIVTKEMEIVAKKENIDVKEMVRILNKESGLLGLSNGLSSDFRDLNEAAEGGNELDILHPTAHGVRLALPFFCQRTVDPALNLVRGI